MSTKKTRIKTNALPVPASQSEAETLLEEIGLLQRQVARIETEMNDALAEVKARHEEAARPLNEEIEAKFQALHAWAEANRAELLRKGGKTAKLATGEVSWRTTPPSVSIRQPNVVIETLKRLGLSDLVRTKEEVNKEGILADPKRVEGIAGISISQREEFVAKPFESQIERAEPVKKVA